MKRPTPSDLRTGQSFLERLGVLYAYPIRRTILIELHMREMSPKQFYEQVGGTSYDSVRRHFVKLARSGWLRKVRSAPSGRGRPEHLYRSTELAIIDDETWAQLPVSLRDAFTLELLEEMGERLAESLQTKAFYSRGDNVLSFVVLVLDQIGWSDVITTLNRSFRSLFEEQTDAKIRLEKSGGTPIQMVVELAGFETLLDAADAPPGGVRPETALGAARPERIAKLFGDPLNLAIVNLLNDSAMSPSQLASVTGAASVADCDRRCKMLEKYGWVTKVGERTGGVRRGATENFYQARSPVFRKTDLCPDVPIGARNAEAWKVFGELCERALRDIGMGVFNREPSRHLTLSTLLVDEIGWSQVIALLQSCARSLSGIEQAAKHRIRNGASPRPTGFFAAAFSGPLSR